MNDTTPQRQHIGPPYPTDTIKPRRQAKGLTQMKLAAMLDCHLDTLRQWEQGRYNPSPKHQAQLDQILGPAPEQEERK